uniref:Lactosylceramide 4-alpha-galactosyltransferase n=2 Tax=Latimeria chalumnae TaxID=7897 RepID=H2ZTZ3_LATCH|nr:PREDICTED: lactosylceramide 4-alpha-galactosyltransferase-like [Latimeria chalumnae]|eukprot:XP_006014090.1 PREDICTED: lactosylceramide 4-alpha-galactosyltransferase-like [Latimeria chalumnae]
MKKIAGSFLLIVFTFALSVHVKYLSNIFGISCFPQCRIKKQDRSNGSGEPEPRPLSFQRNVFFVETSQRTNFSFLFTCSVESAARAHPNSNVTLFMRGLPGADAGSGWPRSFAVSILSTFPNVRLKPLDLAELFSNTPLHGWYARLNQSQERYLFPVLSDACRLALMYKFGGVYLDTDVIVLRNLMNFTNALGLQSSHLVNGAFLAFQPKDEFMGLCLQDFVDHYQGNVWGHQGPNLLTRVLEWWCGISTLASCRGVTVLREEAFYPIPYQNWKVYFRTEHGSLLKRLQKTSYAVHIWNKMSAGSGTRMKVGSNVLLERLFAEYCPSTYSHLRKQADRNKDVKIN